MSLQEILIKVGKYPFGYPVPARTPERDGFIRPAHNCLAVHIEDESDKSGNFGTAIGLIAQVAVFCAWDKGYDAKTVARICEDFRFARTVQTGLLNKSKFLIFEGTIFIDRKAERDAADRGDAQAQYSLGRSYAEGSGCLRKDLQEAVRLYKLAAGTARNPS